KNRPAVGFSFGGNRTRRNSRRSQRTRSHVPHSGNGSAPPRKRYLGNGGSRIQRKFTYAAGRDFIRQVKSPAIGPAWSSQRPIDGSGNSGRTVSQAPTAAKNNRVSRNL